MSFRVLVDDNFHYMDVDARTTLGDFETLEAAVAAAQALVDEWLTSAYQPGMSADEFYQGYIGFGEDPFIVAPGLSGVPFSAWNYARERCAALCAAPSGS
jgi:hypothetical protein